ncbi:DUF4065 domain-containing protein [Sporomusa sphaeroides]|uniref:type II TA system antitoxin MqsA family protein n=1 Tax=Sporomusa sphaeroides TaxID=47679 RepID=UPI003D9FD20F
MKNRKIICPHSKTLLITKEESYIVKGEEITIEAQVMTCEECGEEIFAAKYDDNNLKKAYDIYRKNHNLVGAETIVQLRQKYQLSQRAFAVLIGCTQATINRYENGAIPDPAYNALIRLMEKPENVYSMLEDRRNQLDVRDTRKLEEVLDRLISDERKTKDIFSLISIYQCNQPDIFTGFKKFDRNKFIAMVLFFASNQQNLYKTKLMKLLWYADMLNFQRYVKSISGMKYVHQHYGPIPENHELLLGVLKAADYIDLLAEDSQCNWEKVKAKADPDLGCLSEEEIEVLNDVNRRFKDESSNSISDISHREAGYEQTGQNQFISYKFAEQLIAIE